MSEIKTFDSREGWLEARRSHIGGSDAPIILGVTSWSSPLQVWHQKIGAGDFDESNVMERLKWGNRLESAIREAYAEETGRAVDSDPPHSFRVSPEYPIMSASLDGIVLPIDDRGPGVLQIKTADAYTKAKWKDEAPVEYQVQVQHEMAASGFNWASIAVLLGGNTFMYFDIPRDQEFIDAMIDEEQRFWRFVEQGVPPPPSGAEGDGRILSKIYGVSAGKSIDFGQDAIELHEQLVTAKEVKKNAEKAEALAKQGLLSLMGDAEFGFLPDGSGYKRTERYRDGFTVAPTNFTELRYVKKKKRG